MNLNDVQQTLFFPLMGRAEAARRWPDLFPDPWAEHAMSIRESEGSTAQQLGAFPTAVYGLRHLLTIREINAYLTGHPGAAIVNIGCGLDRIVHEIVDPDSLVYNLDFPEVLQARDRWIDPHEREVALPYSATDHRWMDHVDAGRGLIAIAAGVFYYFEVDEVRALVREMGTRFPGGRLCYDAESPKMTAGSEKSIHRNGTPDARMPFRVKDPYSVRTWSDRIDDVRIEFDFSSYLPGHSRSQLPRGIRFGFTAMRLLKSMYEVVVTFTGSAT